MRNRDNSYILVPDRNITPAPNTPNPIQSSVSSKGNLVGFTPRLNDIKTALNQSIVNQPSSNPIQVGVDINMQDSNLVQNVKYNDIASNTLKSPVLTKNTIYGTSVVEAQTLRDNPEYQLIASSIYIKKTPNINTQTPINLISITATVFNGQIIVITSEVNVQVITINSAPINYNLGENSTVSILCSKNADNTYKYLIVNTGYINSFESSFTPSSNYTVLESSNNPITIYKNTTDDTITINLPTLTYFGQGATTGQVIFTYSGQAPENIKPNMLYLFTATTTKYFYRVNSIVFIDKPNSRITLTLDYTFNTSLTGITGKAIGYSFDFNSVNLIKFKILAKINSKLISPISLIKSTSDITRASNTFTACYKNANNQICNTQGDYFLLTPFLSTSYISSLVLECSIINNNLIGNYNEFSDVSTNGSVYSSSTTFSTNTPNRLEIYFYASPNSSVSNNVVAKNTTSFNILFISNPVNNITANVDEGNYISIYYTRLKGTTLEENTNDEI